MQDGQNRSIANRIQEFIGMPTGGQRSGLGFAITDHTGSNQIRIIKDRAKSMSQGIAQLTALVNGTGSFGRDVAGNAAGKRELFEELPHAVFILGNIGIEFAIGAFKIRVGHKSWSTVTRAGNINDIKLPFLDDAIKMDINQVQPGCGAPVTEQASFDVSALERFSEQGIIQ